MMTAMASICRVIAARIFRKRDCKNRRYIEFRYKEKVNCLPLTNLCAKGVRQNQRKALRLLCNIHSTHLNSGGLVSQRALLRNEGCVRKSRP